MVLLAAQDWSQNVLRRFSYGSCFPQVRQIFGRTAYRSRAARLDARLFSWIFDAAFRYPSFPASLASTCRLPTEQVEGLEPPSTDYETVVLPLNHTCVFCVSNYHLPCSAYLSYPTISREGGNRTRNLRLPMPARSQRELHPQCVAIRPRGGTDPERSPATTCLLVLESRVRFELTSYGGKNPAPYQSRHRPQCVVAPLVDRAPEWNRQDSNLGPTAYEADVLID